MDETPNTRELRSEETSSAQRRYSANEVADLRFVCGHIYVWGTAEPSPQDSGCYSQQYNRHDKEIAVEHMVQTYMLAGVTADDLRAQTNPGSGVSAQQTPTATQEKQ